MAKEQENQDNQALKDKNPAMLELQNQLEQSKKDYQALQQQLQQNKQLETEKAQEALENQKAEEAAALAEEADLKKALMSVENDKYESLTNKEMIDVMVSAIESTSEARSTQITQTFDDKLGALTTDLSNAQKAIMSIATTMDMKTTKDNHPDFDKYQQDAGVIMQNNPGMSVKDAYLLAKAREVEQSPSKENTDRERPDTTVSRSNSELADSINERRNRQKDSASERHDSKKRGIVGARSIIDAGIDAVHARRRE